MICAFCGHVSGVMDSQKDATKKMAEHIVDCEKHPLRNAAVMLAAKDAEVAALVEMLRKVVWGWSDEEADYELGTNITIPLRATLAAYEKGGDDGTRS